MERNLYPPDFCEAIIQQALNKILNADENEKDNNMEKQSGDKSSDAETQEPIRKKIAFLNIAEKSQMIIAEN